MTTEAWSKTEKTIARRAYAAAYARECAAIAEEARRRLAQIDEPEHLWQAHDYLTDKRRETDAKYDYRYSVLMFVFGRLMGENWITEEDLAGLSEDKLCRIREIARFQAGE